MPAKSQAPSAPQPPEPRPAKPEIKLPLLCKAIHLAQLPGQDPDTRFAVIWGGIREPKEGMGYVVQLTGKRTGRVLGWLRDGGKAYACDNIVREVPADEPAVTLAVWEEDKRAGRVTVPTPSGGVRMVSELAIGLGNTYAFVRPLADLGMPYAQAKLNFREFLAVAFLAFSYLPSLSPAEEGPDDAPQDAGAADVPATGDKGPDVREDDGPTGTMSDVLDLFRTFSYPDAVDALLLDVDEGRRVSGFEAYAARILRAAGAAKLRGIAARHEISIVRLSTTRLFWTRFSAAALGPDELSVVLALETALNRLVLVQRVFRRAASGARVAEQADDLSRYPETLCAYQDLRIMDGIGKMAPQLLDGENHDNVWQTVRSTTAKRGGEWDVRTRFAAACEALSLPARFAYRFCADAAAGALAVRVYVPDAAQMPQEEWSDEKAAWENRAAQAPAAARAYAVRIIWQVKHDGRFFRSVLLSVSAFKRGVFRRAILCLAPQERKDAEHRAVLPACGKLCAAFFKTAVSAVYGARPRGRPAKHNRGKRVRHKYHDIPLSVFKEGRRPARLYVLCGDAERHRGVLAADEHRGVHALRL